MAGTVVIGSWVSGQIEESIIHESAATTALYLDSFVTPNLQDLESAESLTPKSREALNSLLESTDIGRQIVTIKVWDEEGRILFSNRPSLIGRQFGIPEDLAAAWNGDVVSAISALDEAEHVEERQLYSNLLEIYVPVRQTGKHKVIAVAEFYQEAGDLQAEIARSQRQSWVVVGTGMGLMYLWLAAFFRSMRTRLRKQEEILVAQVEKLTELLSQNEELDMRIRQAVANAATNDEMLLGRISLELREGPAQKISMALTTLDQVLAATDACRLVEQKIRCNQNLPAIQSALGTSLQEMNALATGLGLPQLDGLTLSEAFLSAVKSHEARTGTTVSFIAETLPKDVALPIKMTAYRVVQEALSNCYKHAGGIGQRVQVQGHEESLMIAVTDLGPGFDPAQSHSVDDHLGLAGMRERVESLGGVFEVETGRGAGTTIRARLLLATKTRMFEPGMHASHGERM